MKTSCLRWVALALLLWTLPAAAQQDSDFAVMGNNGQFTIEGYVGPPGVVNIPTTIYGWTVVAIDDYAFSEVYNTPGITKVVIPDTVISIGSRTFWQCSSLTNVVMGNGVVSLGDETFEECYALTAITLSTNLNNIGGWDFWGAGLTSIAIPNRVTSIGESAFTYCGSLTNVTIGNSVTNIGILAFGLCGNLTNVTLPDSLIILGGSAFQGCGSLSRITIPNRVTSIGQGAFMDCSGLTSATIGTNVTGIGDFAFRDCTRLTSIVIPDSVTDIGMDAFYSCSSLTNLVVGAGVTNISSWAFTYCNPTSVRIPGSVASIGAYALGGWYNANAIYFLGNAPTNLGSGVLQGDPATVYYLPGTTGWGPYFAGCPTVMWNPQAQAYDGSFGVRTNRQQRSEGRGAGLHESGPADLVAGGHQHANRRLVVFRRFGVDESSPAFLRLRPAVRGRLIRLRCTTPRQGIEG
jgi:hypothetical protein